MSQLSPSPPRRDGRARRAIDAAERLEESVLRLQYAFLALIPALCGERRIHAEHRRQPRVILARDRGIRRGGQPADRRRRQRDRLRHLRRVEPQQPRRRHRGGEHRAVAAVKAARAEAWRDRLADAPGGLVAADDRCQHRLAAAAVAFGDRQRDRGQRRAGMDDVAQVAVVGCGGIAHHGIRLRGIGDRDARIGIEPQRCVGPAAAFARQVADDPRGGKLRPRRGTGDRAGDDHRRVVDCLRRQIGHGDAGKEIGQLAGNGHRASLLLRSRNAM